MDRWITAFTITEFCNDDATPQRCQGVGIHRDFSADNGHEA